MIERSENAERIEPTLAKEPTANAEANEPIEPMHKIEPILPIDKIEFWDPIDSTEPSDRIEHQEPWFLMTEIMARSTDRGTGPMTVGGDEPQRVRPQLPITAPPPRTPRTATSASDPAQLPTRAGEIS